MRHHRLPLSTRALYRHVSIYRSISTYLTTHQPQRIAKILDSPSGAEPDPIEPTSSILPRVAVTVRCLSSLSVCASAYALSISNGMPSIAPLTSWYALRASYSFSGLFDLSTKNPRLASPWLSSCRQCQSHLRPRSLLLYRLHHVPAASISQSQVSRQDGAPG